MRFGRGLPIFHVLAGQVLILLLTFLPIHTAHADGPPYTAPSAYSLMYRRGYGAPNSGPGYAPLASGSIYGSSSFLYEVEPGDTLFGIAARFGVSAVALARINHLFNPNFIFAEMRLVIPRSNSYTPALMYTVRPGDTLTRIAIRFQKTVITLLIANHIANPNLIFPGMRLVIPGRPSSVPYGSQAPSYAPPPMMPYPIPAPGPTMAPGAGMSASVSLQNIAYHPGSITVKAGTRILWTNMETSPIPHTVTSGTPNAPSGIFDSGTLNPRQSFQFTFNSPGTFAYFCRIHGAAMTGTVNVVP